MTTKTKFALGVVSASVLALIAGCGGGGGGDSAPPKETDKPYVLADKVVPTVGGSVPNSGLIVTVPLNEPLACFDGVKSFSVTTSVGIATGKYVCVGSVITITVDNASIEKATSVAFILSGLTDVAGNLMVPFTWSYTLVPPLATVTLTATPDTPIVAGKSATLTWAPTNAANCVASGGWLGSLTPAGGSQAVTPTTTTTYSAQCWNSANIATDIKSVTVTVTPKPVVTYPAVVILFGPNWVHRVDPTAPDGIAPIANNTGHPRIGAFGFRATALPNCKVQVSALGNENGVISTLYDRVMKDLTLDVSGTAPPRLLENYIFFSLGHPAFPKANMGLVVGDEQYWNPVQTNELWYQKGVAPAVMLGTYPIGITALIAIPACTPVQ